MNVTSLLIIDRRMYQYDVGITYEFDLELLDHHLEFDVMYTFSVLSHTVTNAVLTLNNYNINMEVV